MVAYGLWLLRFSGFWVWNGRLGLTIYPSESLLLWRETLLIDWPSHSENVLLE